MNEYSWINWTKVMCMLCVYFFHSMEYTGMYDFGFSFLYSFFYTDAFFFLSGYLLFSRQLKSPLSEQSLGEYVSHSGGGHRLFLNVLNKLVLPTLLFSTINYFPKRILRGDGIEISSFLHDTVCGGSIWFTCSLAVAELLLLVFFCTRIKNIWFYFICASGMAAVAYVLAKNGVSIMGSLSSPWYYKGGMVASLILVSGGLYWKYEECIRKTISGRNGILTMCFLVVLIVLLYRYSEFSVQNGKMNVVGYIVVVSSIGIVISVCRYLPKLAIIDYLGRRSLGLYFLSGSIPNLAAILISKFGVGLHAETYVATSVLSFVCACVFASALYKFLPFVFDFSKVSLKKFNKT